MKQVKYINLTLGLLLFWSLLSAQNLEEDLVKVNNVFENDAYSLQVSYNVYKSYDAKQVFYSTEGKMYKNGIQNYQKIDAVEIVKNENFTLTVDHDNKLIYILGAAYTEMGEQPEKALDPIKNVLKYCSKHEFFNESQSVSGYQLWPEESEYEKMTFTFDNQSYLLKEITLYFKETEDFDDASVTIQPKMVLKIENFDAAPQFPNHCFSYQNFLKKNEAKQFECKPAFKQYTLKQALN